MYRISKEIIEDQKHRETDQCWYSQVCEEGEEYKLPVQDVGKYTKSEWKKLVKSKIMKNIVNESIIKRRQMKKLEILKNQKYERQSYLNYTSVTEVTDIIKTKLHMWDIGRNM